MKTCLYERHVTLGAKIIDFCGWKMPVYYNGIIQEHRAVRQAVGLFDVSHMGQIEIEGEDAEPFLDYISTNAIIGKKNGAVIYTVFCNQQGFSVDDVMVFRFSSERFFVIVNACSRNRVLDHLKKEGSCFKIRITEFFLKNGILALQGPLAEQFICHFFPQAKTLLPMHFAEFSDERALIIISRTGYTGAGGFEIFGSNERIVYWWDLLLKEGKSLKIEPAGLGARDTLRLEMGYALYGHEISLSIAPTESVAAWTVKWDKDSFLGKTALLRLESNVAKRREYGIVFIDSGIARAGDEVRHLGQPIGVVTSGTFSPTLQRAIAIILVNTHFKLGDTVDVLIRQKLHLAQIVELPFIPKNWTG